jgi:hypothetical protein
VLGTTPTTAVTSEHAAHAKVQRHPRAPRCSRYLRAAHLQPLSQRHVAWQLQLSPQVHRAVAVAHPQLALLHRHALSFWLDMIVFSCSVAPWWRAL